MKGLLEDLKHAIRLYRRTPGASLVAVGVLATGMAFLTAFVSLYTDLALRQHGGFDDAARLVTFGRNDGASLLDPDTLDRIASESATLEAVAGITPRTFLIGEEGETVTGEVVTAGFFGGLRPRLLLGTGLGAAEHQPDGAPAAVISHAYWQQAFGGSPDVIGMTFQLQAAPLGGGNGGATESAGDRVQVRVLGVAAPTLVGLTSSSGDAGVAFWFPLEQYLPLLASASEGMLRDEAFLRRSATSLKGIGRRAGSVGNAAVAAELNARYFEDTEFAAVPAARFGVLDGIVHDAGIHRSAQRQLRLLLGASLLLSLVAAANVSLFLLARAPARRRELGIRMAVGATTARLARQLGSEAAVIVMIATLLGLTLSVWIAPMLQGLEFLRRAQWRDVTLFDWHVVAIIGVLYAVLVLLVSLAPILGLKKLGIDASSRQVSARAGFGQRFAGTAQIAIAGALAGPAIAFSWYLGGLMLAHPGYETRDLHAVRYAIDSDRYYSGSDGAERFHVEQSRRREAIESLPSVTGVSLASAVPGMSGGVQTAYFANPDDPARQLGFTLVTIDAAYIDLLGLTLLHGRVPGANEPTAMLVNQSLAREFWNREDVVGEVIGAPPRSAQVVGVLADLPYGHPAADAEPRAFSIWTQQFLSSGVALVRSAGSAAALRQDLQRLVDEGALEVQIRDVSPLGALRTSTIAADLARGFVAVGAAALVMLLAGFGFYGMQRYLVAAGRREYAIRASLGADPRALRRLVMRRGVMLGLPGLALALPIAFMLVAWLRDDYLSRQISPWIVSVAVCASMALLLFAATAGPARQARKTQPASLLRED